MRNAAISRDHVVAGDHRLSPSRCSVLADGLILITELMLAAL